MPENSEYPKCGWSLEDCLPFKILYCRKCDRHFDKSTSGKITEHFYWWEDGDTD